jgi:hypothetical protein
VGIWDWLTRKPKSLALAEDIIWMTSGAKLWGLCRDAQDRLADGGSVVVVTHFQATLTQVQEGLVVAGVPTVVAQGSLLASDVRRWRSRSGESRPTLTLAEAPVPSDAPDPLEGGAGSLSLLVAERHFLRIHDDRIISFAASLGRPCCVRFHQSLHDPLMRLFAGEWVGGILSQLGAKETDPIESSMVARRIQAAQDRFAKQVVEEQQADSAEEWLRLNAPQRG